MISQPVDTIMTALMGTHNILEIAKKHAVNAFVYISSMEVYGSFNDETYVHEDTMGYINPLALRSNYPLGKRMCENIEFQYELQDFHKHLELGFFQVKIGCLHNLQEVLFTIKI